MTPALQGDSGLVPGESPTLELGGPFALIMNSIASASYVFVDIHHPGPRLRVVATPDTFNQNPAPMAGHHSSEGFPER